eukprot:CAMPEP_0181329046 /NCGR_PEP_ID=MMETSP1101-20121128/23088_1 /TAXON_ID=46948 /ORGANISM="Rhodomonas abbreviata, Strain Caron Lab Isolate" /LENGTH=80 /DNA_ID=CAMNT_0023438071 /DNA_START=87 /DNA_END=326 /DNA_ORIENTATION=+
MYDSNSCSAPQSADVAYLQLCPQASPHTSEQHSKGECGGIPCLRGRQRANFRFRRQVFCILGAVSPGSTLEEQEVGEGTR